METLTETRPYPLLLAEKAAGVVEGAVKSTSNPFKKRVQQDEDSVAGKKPKQRVVVLGVGWGAAAFLKNLDTDRYDITVISPRNHFVFTPMLSASSVGSVEYRSICQPVREINKNAKYLEAAATAIDPKTRSVSCLSTVCSRDEENCEIPDEFTIEYDRLVVTVGATTNTFNIPGVEEHCHFIKEISDAKYIRAKLVNSLERANVPGLSEEEIRRRLSIVIVGAGPAGVELAAELRDFIREDGPRHYCELLPYVSIKLVEATGAVLAPFEKALQEEAIQRLTGPVQRNCPIAKSQDKLPEGIAPVELLLNSPVTEVTADKIKIKGGRVLDHSLVVWAGGIKPIPLTSDLIQSLGQGQQQEQASARGRIAVDPWLRAFGGEGRVMALGDCAVNPEHPLPPTGQVASQQGEFLAQLMNHNYNLSVQPTCDGLLPPPMKIPGETQESLEETVAALATHHMEYAKPFQYLDLGILAYTGDHTALAQVKLAPSMPPLLSKGKLGNFLWRSVYLAKQVSWRNRFLILNDWLKQVWFGGRDIPRL